MYEEYPYNSVEEANIKHFILWHEESLAFSQVTSQIENNWKFSSGYEKIPSQVKFVTAVKFHYRVLQLTAVFLTIRHLWGNIYFAGDDSYIIWLAYQ